MVGSRNDGNNIVGNGRKSSAGLLAAMPSAGMHELAADCSVNAVRRRLPPRCIQTESTCCVPASPSGGCRLRLAVLDKGFQWPPLQYPTGARRLRSHLTSEAHSFGTRAHRSTGEPGRDRSKRGVPESPTRRTPGSRIARTEALNAGTRRYEPGRCLRALPRVAERGHPRLSSRRHAPRAPQGRLPARRTRKIEWARAVCSVDTRT